MLLIRELARVASQTVAYSFVTRRIVLIVVLASTALLAALSLTIVKAVPVAIYPFL